MGLADGMFLYQVKWIMLQLCSRDKNRMRLVIICRSTMCFETMSEQGDVFGDRWYQSMQLCSWLQWWRLGMYTCQCVAGYTGTNNETGEKPSPDENTKTLFPKPPISDIDECESSPCKTGETCQDLANSYVCNCTTGYIDDICKTGK